MTLIKIVGILQEAVDVMEAVRETFVEGKINTDGIYYEVCGRCGGKSMNKFPDSIEHASGCVIERLEKTMNDINYLIEG